MYNEGFVYFNLCSTQQLPWLLVLLLVYSSVLKKSNIRVQKTEVDIFLVFSQKLPLTRCLFSGWHCRSLWK